MDSNDENGRYIKIRGLVSGGVAEQQGQLKAQDKLVFVNEFHFDMNRFTLQDCVAMLKSLPPGMTTHYWLSIAIDILLNRSGSVRRYA